RVSFASPRWAGAPPATSVQKSAGNRLCDDSPPGSEGLLGQTPLEIQLQGKLHNPRWRSHGDGAERSRSGCRIEVAKPNLTRSNKLGVIKNIEQLRSELEVEPLVDLGILQDIKIPVVHARPAAEPPVGSPFLAQRGSLERTGIEKQAGSRTSRFSRIQLLYRSDEIGSIHTKRNGSSKAGA